MTTTTEKLALESAQDLLVAFLSHQAVTSDRFKDVLRKVQQALADHSAAQAQASEELRADGMPASANERYLRRLLALRAAMPHTYYDDGEAQGEELGVVIDFMREPVADIDAKLRALNCARAGRASSQAVPIDAIGKLLAEAMNAAVENGANSVSMPDEYVEIAVWLATAAPKGD